MIPPALEAVVARRVHPPRGEASVSPRKGVKDNASLLHRPSCWLLSLVGFYAPGLLDGIPSSVWMIGPFAFLVVHTCNRKRGLAVLLTRVGRLAYVSDNACSYEHLASWCSQSASVAYFFSDNDTCPPFSLQDVAGASQHHPKHADFTPTISSEKLHKTPPRNQLISTPELTN